MEKVITDVSHRLSRDRRVEEKRKKVKGSAGKMGEKNLGLRRIRGSGSGMEISLAYVSQLLW
jgi:hypothetical protein